MIIGLGLAGGGIAVLTLSSGGPFPFESVASFVSLAVGGIYVTLGIVHWKTKVVTKFVRVSHTPLWLYLVGLLLVFVIVYYLLAGIGGLSIIGAIISLIITLIITGVYAIWTTVDRLTKHVTHIPFLFYISMLLPVLVLTYFLFGALFR